MDGTDHTLPEALFQQISHQGEILHFAEGELLFEEGDRPDGLYLLLEGMLKVCSTGTSSREVVYNILGPGQFLGEMLLDGGTRSASVNAMTKATCSVIRSDKLRELLRTEPDLAEHLILKLISRVRALTHKARSLALNGVKARVITLLEEHSFLEGDVRGVPRSLTQQEIANRIGASREMVNHVLRDLINGQYIQKSVNHRMTILKDLPKRD